MVSLTVPACVPVSAILPAVSDPPAARAGKPAKPLLMKPPLLLTAKAPVTPSAGPAAMLSAVSVTAAVVEPARTVPRLSTTLLAPAPGVSAGPELLNAAVA